MFDEINAELRMGVAVDTILSTVTYLRGLKLMLAGAYMAAPKDSEAEKNAGAAFQHACDALAWLELRAASLSDEALPVAEISSLSLEPTRVVH